MRGSSATTQACVRERRALPGFGLEADGTQRKWPVLRAAEKDSLVWSRIGLPVENRNDLCPPKAEIPRHKTHKNDASLHAHKASRCGRDRLAAAALYKCD